MSKAVCCNQCGRDINVPAHLMLTVCDDRGEEPDAHFCDVPCVNAWAKARGITRLTVCYGETGKRP